MGTRPGKVVCVWLAVTLCARLNCQGWYWLDLGFRDWLGAAGVHSWACPSSLHWERERDKDVSHPGVLPHMPLTRGEDEGAGSWGQDPGLGLPEYWESVKVEFWPESDLS